MVEYDYFFIVEKGQHSEKSGKNDQKYRITFSETTTFSFAIFQNRKPHEITCQTNQSLLLPLLCRSFKTPGLPAPTALFFSFIIFIFLNPPSSVYLE